MGQKLRFAHLHQHTQYSLLDGAAKLSDLLQWVKEVSPEDPALAMTDHGNLFGALEFYKKATALGVKPIIGYEAYVAAESRFDRKRGKGLDGGYFHLTLLAKDFKGYQNLVRLATRAYLEGFYEKPRIDREILREHAEGLIALSGCLGAEIPQFILQDRLDLAEARLKEYLSIFGDRFFIEIQNHGLPEQRKVNAVLKEFARKYGLGMVATNDGHYVRKEDARAHEVLLAIQSKSTLDDEDRWRFPCDEFYVKTPEEMRAVLPEEEWGDEPFDNTVEIARMCNVDLPIGDKMVYRIPRYPLPEGRTEAQYLMELTLKGLLRRYPDRITEGFYREVFRRLGLIPPHGDGEALAEALAQVGLGVWERLRAELPPLEGVKEWTAEAILHRALYELSVIEKMGFPGYFLIVQDYINWARENGISVGPGRGSAAGSLVAYAVGITNIDPLRFGLLFERFLNPERVSMPDIDTDFSDRERDRVIQYVKARYGEDKVAQIGTLGTLASKAALKDVARVYGIPHKRAEELAKLIPVQFGRPKPLQEAIQVVPELRAEMERDPKVREVLEVAMRLEGLNRHASVHAAGVVIAAEPLTNLVPLMRDTNGEAVVTQYDMGAVEALGLLKMDFLGLRTLTFLDEAKRIVRESRGVELDYDHLPLDDPKTFALLARGETKGVFQLESGGMMATLRGLKPRRFEDLVAILSLYRPGPMEHIPTYIRRHHGQEPVNYAEFPHAEKYLRPILDETYGIPVYQEQIMQIAAQVAGYSLGEADLLRRAMGKKRVEEMQKHRARFVQGAAERGVPEEEANRLFDMLEAFANYGFNKSHAAAYSLLSYQTAYVKAHYPVEFMAALLSVERHDSDKVAEYIRDARAMGIPVLPPDVNRSGFDFKVVGEEILFGLSAVKNVGEAAARAILEERERGGPYRSLGDFLKRLPEQVVNKRALESLVKAGALDAFGDRARILASLEALLKWAAQERERARSGMMGLFQEVAEPPLLSVPPLDEITRLRYEKEALGIYVSGHPVLRYPGLREVATCTLEELQEFAKGPGRPRLLLAGMVEEVVRKPTRSGGMMARFTLSDETGAQEVVAFGRFYEFVSPKLKEDLPVLVLAEVERTEENLRVVALSVWPYEELQEMPRAIEVEADHALLDEWGIAHLKSLLDEHPGDLPLYLRVQGPFGEAVFALREVRVSEAILPLLEAEGFRAYLLPDREPLLQGPNGGPKEEVVPF